MVPSAPSCELAASGPRLKAAPAEAAHGDWLGGGLDSGGLVDLELVLVGLVKGLALFARAS